ncbi:hypothetical protein [Cellulomonas wangsupingiae]|uniref:DUF2530 domain-containing protein n=1 Tax=Cellulomonas wangsupingiae TaxID=2968085 RepID=A0ABY5K084_9CELL|nr:hypothetical protein [Cellulomonas wangsupingiae]MCC2333305.1 hypothetical protein [Cellulomonas wangsupingiae]MCM0638158.1 hypothetical protein [Cellulomonas wangsupingiae]UUI63508.1 hypothetical protein NP075_10045 [Cellulomonas wangsupingiae]
MAQHPRTERVLGTVGALSLWLSGVVSMFGFFIPAGFLVGAGIAVMGAALLWCERIVARRNMRERLGYDWHEGSREAP